jgi:hypothetical protein
LCKYRTVCAAPLVFSDKKRTEQAAFLDRALFFLEPALSDIQAELRQDGFSEDLSVFQALKKAAPALGVLPGLHISVRAYLTEEGLKEFQIEEDAFTG